MSNLPSQFYVGQKVNVLSRCVDWDPNAPRNTIIQFINDERSRAAVYKPKEYGGYHIPGHSEYESWWVALQSLAPLESPKLITKPYPHRCPTCQSPARKTSSLVLCSRPKCSRNKANGRFRITKAAHHYKHLRSDGFLMCYTCGVRMIATMGFALSMIENVLICDCPNKHTNEMKIENGFKMACFIDNDRCHYVWNNSLVDGGWIHATGKEDG